MALLQTPVLILCSLLIISCTDTRKATETTKPAEAPAAPLPAEVQVADSLYRLVISFYSIGSGTDYNAKEHFENFLSTFETANSAHIQYEKTPWGREGEVDYCFKLRELQLNGQEQFISAIKSLLKEASHIYINENVPCRHKRR